MKGAVFFAFVILACLGAVLYFTQPKDPPAVAPAKTDEQRIEEAGYTRSPAKNDPQPYPAEWTKDDIVFTVAQNGKVTGLRVYFANYASVDCSSRLQGKDIFLVASELTRYTQPQLLDQRWCKAA